jgi:UDP-2,4-diacetamido-2,4,6-trideoxy-beta-L-altropyranose hydrolase
MGLGHLRRCLSLAHALRSLGADCVFVTRDLGLDIESPITNAGHRLRLLPAPTAADAGGIEAGPAHAAWAGVGAVTDAAQTVAALRHHAPQQLVVDHYAFDARWHRAVADALGCALVAIDDTADRPLAAALVVDHNHCEDHRAKYGAHVAAGTRLLGGPRYALLGPAYADAPRCEVRATVASIGIFMGGSDPEGYSLLALQACADAGFQGAVEIASTRAHPALDALAAAVRLRPNTRLLLDQPDLAAFFARHDLQIGAGGGATWERCCIGAPTLALVTAENQRSVLQPLVALDVMQVVDVVPPTAAAVARALAALIEQPGLRARQAAAARRLVDGHGGRRVAQEVLQAC